MARGFVQVEEPDPAPLSFRPPVQDPAETSQAAEMLALALRGLSQRAAIAISSLFTAAGLLSAWWLWATILPAPTDRQLSPWAGARREIGPRWRAGGARVSPDGHRPWS